MPCRASSGCAPHLVVSAPPHLDPIARWCASPPPCSCANEPVLPPEPRHWICGLRRCSTRRPWLVDVDLSQGFEVGQDTPSLGDPSTPLEIDAAAAHALAEWFRYGWAVLD